MGDYTLNDAVTDIQNYTKKLWEENSKALEDEVLEILSRVDEL